MRWDDAGTVSSRPDPLFRHRTNVLVEYPKGYLTGAQCRAIRWGMPTPHVLRRGTLAAAVTIGPALLTACGASPGTDAPATVTSVSVAPATVALQAGASQQFAVTGKYSDGTVEPVSVEWTAEGGQVTGSGLYSAPASAGTYRVIARLAAGTLADTATVVVSVVPPPPPPPPSVNEPELPRTTVSTVMPALSGRVLLVSEGGELQAALDSAERGDQVVLQAGATFVGDFVLPAKPGAGWIVIRSSMLGSLPAGQRVGPGQAGVMARLEAHTGGTVAVLRTAPGASQYWVAGLEVTAPEDVGTMTRLVDMGNGTAATVAASATGIVLDRTFIHGHARLDLRRCVALNSAASAVINSWLSDCHAMGADAQAIVAWNTPGPLLIENDRLEGAAENVMLGGADPAGQAMVPSDVTIRFNHFTKPLAWKVDDPAFAGRQWSVKNLLEFKNARRVLVEGNLFEQLWSADQAGFALLVKSVNQDGTAPWSQTTDVTVRYNRFRRVAHGVNVANVNNVTSRIKIVNNLFAEVGGAAWGVDVGILLQCQGGADIIFAENTGLVRRETIVFDETPVVRFAFLNNIVSRGQLGIKGSGSPEGDPSIAAYTSEAFVSGNVLVGATTSPYTGFVIAPNEAALGFASPGTGDYRLNAGSPYSRGGGAMDPGVDMAALDQMLAQAAPSP